MLTEPGDRVGAGRTSSVLALGDDRIVKIFTSGVDADAIDKEVRDSTEVFRLGLTPIRCYGRLELPDGRIGVVFDRLTGEALTTLAERRPYRIPAVARALARQHAIIHTQHSDAFDDVREVATELLQSAPLASLTDAERRVLAQEIRSLPAGNSVLHLDFHPLNVFEHEGSTVTIDWQSTAAGHPAADVAATRLLFTEAELFPGISVGQRVVYQCVRRVMLRIYLGEYLRLTGINANEIDPWMTTARILRVGWLNVPSERDDLLRQIKAAAGRLR